MIMMRQWLGVSLFLGLTAMQAPAAPSVSITRLDCGELDINQYGAAFSDTFQYPPGSKKLVGSCYLVRHGDRLLLWDTGLTDRLAGTEFRTAEQTLSLRRSLVDQLNELGVRPEQIEYIGISHQHFDHVGQAYRFPKARLLIGKRDADALRATPSSNPRSTDALKHWLSGEGKLEPVSGDRDVFGDGRVVMLDTPGHTPGHNALLVRLASGPVLLTGDVYHFTEQVANRGVPTFNHDRADSLASMDRFDRIAKNLGAKVIIQHEPDDVAKLAPFPNAEK